MLGLGLSPSQVSVRRQLQLVQKIVIEGDSITAPSGSLPTYADRFMTNHPTLNITNKAVGGSSMVGAVSLENRKADVQALAPTHLTVLIGANDLMSYASATAWLTQLYSYTDTFRNAGVKIAVGTVLPRTGNAGFNPRRAEVNSALRAAVGTKIDAVFDFDTCPLGVDGAENDAAKYPDGLHPSAAGQITLQGVYTPVLRWMLGLPNEPQGFAFDPVNGATADTDYDSAAYTVKGLGAGESKNYSVGTGVRVSKNGGAFTLNGSGTVVNGDTLRVRNHSSATAATQTDVVATIGATNATFSVTTAGAGSRDWIPTDLGSKLKLWVRPEGIVGANAAQMTTWADASGNNNVLSTYGTTSKPTVLTNAVNGMKAVKFSNTYGQARFDFPANYLSGRTAGSTFFVAKTDNDPAPSSSNTAGPLFGWGTNGSGDYYPFTNGAVYSSYSSGTRYQTSASKPNLASWRFASFHAATNDWRFYIDGTIVHSLASHTFTTGQYPNFGYDYQSGAFNGQLAEVIDCTAVLTTTERQLVEGYLAWKFGLQANLPTGHPYKDAKPTI